MLSRFWHARVLHYSEGILAHAKGRACPEGFGRIHPIIVREEFLRWQWWLGGAIERWVNVAHRIPPIARLLDRAYCCRYEGVRGPFMPVSSWPSLPIGWEQSVKPYKKARFAHLNQEAERAVKP